MGRGCEPLNSNGFALQKPLLIVNCANSQRNHVTQIPYKLASVPLWLLDPLVGHGRDNLNDVGHEPVEILPIPGSAGGAGIVRGHDDGELDLGHDIKHLPAISPGVAHVPAGDLTQEPAVAVAV